MDKVLIIDDSPDYRLLISAWLAGDYQVIELSSTDEAVERIETEKPACVLLDSRLPKEDGFLFLHRLSKAVEHMPIVIFISGLMDEALKRNVLALGAAECIEKKDIDKEKLITMIHRLCAGKAT